MDYEPTQPHPHKLSTSMHKNHINQIELEKKLEQNERHNYININLGNRFFHQWLLYHQRYQMLFQLF
jgi:hypothetical protein